MKFNLSKYTLSTVYSKEDKCYIATCEEYPEVYAHGKTRYKATKAIKQALQIVLEWEYEDNK